MALTAVALLSGCGSHTPAGQVVARVDGREITETELAAEARAAPGPRAVLLRRVVDRALLAEVARRQGAELSPLYLADLRRTRDVLAGEALRRQLVAGIPEPSEAAVRGFIAAHPFAFGRRALVTLIASDGSAAEADTAMLDPAMAAIVGAAPAGSDLSLGGRRLHIAARREQPVAPGSAPAVARAALIADAAGRRLRALLTEARGHAAIAYQAGFAAEQQ